MCIQIVYVFPVRRKLLMRLAPLTGNSGGSGGDEYHWTIGNVGLIGRSAFRAFLVSDGQHGFCISRRICVPKVSTGCHWPGTQPIRNIPFRSGITESCTSHRGREQGAAACLGSIPFPTQASGLPVKIPSGAYVPEVVKPPDGDLIFGKQSVLGKENGTGFYLTGFVAVGCKWLF